MHLDELVKADGAVAVEVSHLDHLLQIIVFNLLAYRLEHCAQFFFAQLAVFV